ncbi:MAG: aminofutalosine synthase MqnE [Bacteroidales bacterium]|nr:aminofutalosine synthase MqnE [Bacteroidales bacterium]
MISNDTNNSLNVEAQLIASLLVKSSVSKQLQEIAEKILHGERISCDDALVLFEKADLNFVGMLANYVKTKKFGNQVFFNKNIHIEPSNVCIHKCKFCSYYREKDDKESWEYSIDEIAAKLKTIPADALTEVHIVGGCHPSRTIDYYCDLLRLVKQILPHVYIKAFTAVEIEYMAKLNTMSIGEVLTKLKQSGLDAMPGGGAEIFDEKLREEICPSKTKSNDWLAIHKQAHQLGIETNATILYGHKETYVHRIDHLNRLRSLQDETHGFNAFIPLKYKKENNVLGIERELPWTEDLKNFSITRLFLDNIPHLKVYWPMLGKDFSQITLDYGVDDFDGTINDSTKIYSMAGSVEKAPIITQEEMITLIKDSGKIPVERDTLYNIIVIHNNNTIYE